MDRLKEHLVFRIGKEHYAMNAMNVKKIKEAEEIRPVPNTGMKDVLGIISHEKDIVPIIDLRIRFNIESDLKDKIPFIIISRIGDDNASELVVGFVVDEAQDVFDIEENDENLKPINGEFFGESTEYISAIYRKVENSDNNLDEKSKLIIILDAEKLLSKSEFQNIVENI